MSFHYTIQLFSSSRLLTQDVKFQLWVGPGSRAAKEKQFFDSHLAPFYRIEQVVLLLKFMFHDMV